VTTGRRPLDDRARPHLLMGRRLAVHEIPGLGTSENRDREEIFSRSINFGVIAARLAVIGPA
jgi:hypothetical protein